MLLCGFYLSVNSSNDGFKHRASRVVKQVYLVDDEQLNQFKVGSFAAFTCNDVPLLRGRNNELRLFYLLL